MDAPGAHSGVNPAFRADVLAGLAAPIPAVPARWLYDRTGSELFEAITRLPEYYPTRTETDLLEGHAQEVAARVGPGQAVVEFGSGSSAKTPILLRALCPAAYVPIDISGDFLRESSAALQTDFPHLPVHPVEADFVQPLSLPDVVAGLPRLGFFPGSTIGNFVARSAVDLLRAMKETLGEGSLLLIGMDRIKPVERLIAAYDDPGGVTASFNLNLLHRINRELDADVPVDAFVHQARWNDMLTRIEMHLVATRDVTFTVESRSYSFREGESIHTENSHKYGQRGARLLLLAGGWTPVREWVAPDEAFALILAEAQRNRFAP